MRLSIRHLTRYAYDPPAERCALRLKLYPSSFDGQRVLSWTVSVNGAAVPGLLTTGSGDRESIWTAREAAAHIEIIAEGEVETTDTAGVVRGLKDTVRPAVFLRTTPLTAADEAIATLAAGIHGGSTLDRLHALCNAVRDAVDYTPGSTDARTSAAQAFKRGAGVCQDHAHIFIAAARSQNVPARYVVGYLMTEEGGETQTHAWAEGFAPELGWVGFDPANRLCPTDRYIRLSCGLDSVDAAPVRGALVGPGTEELHARVDVNRTPANPAQAQTQTQGQQ